MKSLGSDMSENASMPKLVTVLRPEKIDEQARYYIRLIPPPPGRSDWSAWSVEWGTWLSTVVKHTYSG